MNNLIKKGSEILHVNKFAKNTITYTVSTFFNSATPFLLLPILTRYLTTEEYGTISMFNATVSLLLPFVSMGASSAISRKMVDNDGDEDVYIYNCLSVSVIAEIVMIISTFFFRNALYRCTGIPIKYFPELLVLVLATAFFDDTLGVLQMCNQAKKYSFFQNAATVLNLGVSIATVVGLGMGLSGRIFGLVFSKTVFAFVGLFIIKKEIGIKPKLKKDHVKDVVLNFGIPMIPTMVKSTALTYADRLFITNMVSLSETGVYSVGNQFSLPILLLTQAFNLAYVPWLYEKLKENDDECKKKIVKLTYLYFIIIILLAIAWSYICIPIMGVLSGKNYQGAISYVLWLSLGYAFTGMHMMVVNYIYFYKKLKLYSIVTICVIGSNFVLNYIFINLFGAVGAAQATTIANCVSFILTWILVMKICDMPWFGFGNTKK